MRKKLILSVCMLLILSTLSACSSSNNEDNAKGYELALVTDVGSIDDKAFNQGAWEGLEQYAKENGKTYKYYQPVEKTTSAFLSAIDLAVTGGAKLVVCPGFFFNAPVYEAQAKYPDVKFILLDGEPQTEDYQTKRIDSNVYAIYYAEEQAGFLAGYAAVKDGYTKLGFMGGMAASSVKRYGYGFLQGAEYAAEEMNIPTIDVKYTYTGSFNASPEAQTMASSWYQEGTQVIFACGGAQGNSVMAAAKSNNGKVIGVDVDQSAESDTVITSALKGIKKSVYDAIAAFYNDKFPGGTIATLDVTTQGVSLPLETSHFTVFTKDDFDSIYAKLVSGEIVPSKDVDSPITSLPLNHVKVNVIQ